MDDGSPLDDWLLQNGPDGFERDVFLKGSIFVVVRDQRGNPRANLEVTIRGCGFV